VNIFRDPDIEKEKMLGASAVLAPGRPFDTGLVLILEQYRKPQRGFRHQSCEKIKGETSFMALARIITRSQPCSRQLALDLIARGYAVEIVSPDSIPDNLADLELRVEEDPGNQLVASVEAHNGERTASLEFVHYLKAPMADFIRRPPPEPHHEVHFPELPVRFHAEQGDEDVELPADVPQQASTAVSPTAKILDDSKLGPQPDSLEGARLIVQPGPLPSLPVDPPGHDAVEVSTTARPMIAKQMIAKPAIAKLAIARTVRERKWRDRSAGWSSWRIALPVLSAALLALALGFGMRRTGRASAAQNSAAASTGMNLLNATGHNQDAGKNPVPPPANKSEQNSNDMAKESQVAKAAAATADRGAVAPRRHGDDLIARDTVTYFEKRTFDGAASSAKASHPSATLQPSSRKREGVIAANTVTNSNPASKTAKQDSSVKYSSDLK
jgi:hypothetical protein